MPGPYHRNRALHRRSDASATVNACLHAAPSAARKRGCCTWVLWLASSVSSSWCVTLYRMGVCSQDVWQTHGTHVHDTSCVHTPTHPCNAHAHAHAAIPSKHATREQQPRAQASRRAQASQLWRTACIPRSRSAFSRLLATTGPPLRSSVPCRFAFLRESHQRLRAIHGSPEADCCNEPLPSAIHSSLAC